MSDAKKVAKSKRDKKDCSSELVELKKKCEELENRYKRAVADYRNLERRYEEDSAKIIKLANKVLIGKMLDLVDDFEKAKKHIKDDGFEKIVLKFQRILKDEGLVDIDPKGEPFDPDFHEAIASEDGEEGKIVKVHRKGYMLGDEVLRPAIVTVGKGSSSVQTEQDEEAKGE